MYQIKYDYRTGDSFGSSDEVGTLEYDFDTLEVAKEALKRIQEHYRWYQSKEGWDWAIRNNPKPEWHKTKGNEDKYFKHHYINLLVGDGTDEVFFWCPWCGYFESLYGAKIIAKVDPDLEFII